MSEEQLEALMSRPVMRQVSPRASRSARTSPASWSTVVAVFGGALLLLAGGTWAIWPASHAAASARVAAEAPLEQPLPTGPAFSVVVASSLGADIELGLRRVQELGLPAFAGNAPGQIDVRQAVVGPYASFDEAARARRQLAAIGLSGLAVNVDEASESHAGDVTIDSTSGRGSALRVVGTHGRFSLVLDLTAEPRFVTSRRVSPSTFEVEVGPLARSIRPRRWRAPQGVHLLRRVGLEERSSAVGRNVVVSLDLPELVTASTRAEGRRLYVDLGLPFEPYVEQPQIVATSSPAANQAAPAGPDLRYANSYRLDMESIRRRIVEVQPFVISAARSNSEDVSRAVDQTLAALASSLETMSVPVSEQPSHDRLVAAIREARRGLDPSFTGDRLRQAAQAAALFELELSPGT